MLRAGAEVIRAGDGIVLAACEEDVVAHGRGGGGVANGVGERRRAVGRVADALPHSPEGVGHGERRAEVVGVVEVPVAAARHEQRLVDVVAIDERGRHAPGHALDHLVAGVVVERLPGGYAAAQRVVLVSDGRAVNGGELVVHVVGILVGIVVEQVAVVVVARGELQPARERGVGVHVVGTVSGGHAVGYGAQAVAELVELKRGRGLSTACKRRELRQRIVAVGLRAVGVEQVLALGHVAGGVVGHLQVKHAMPGLDGGEPTVLVVAVVGGYAVGILLPRFLPGGVVVHGHHLVAILHYGGYEVACVEPLLHLHAAGVSHRAAAGGHVVGVGRGLPVERLGEQAAGAVIFKLHRGILVDGPQHTAHAVVLIRVGRAVGVSLGEQVAQRAVGVAELAPGTVARCRDVAHLVVGIAEREAVGKGDDGVAVERVVGVRGGVAARVGSLAEISGGVVVKLRGSSEGVGVR